MRFNRICKSSVFEMRYVRDDFRLSTTNHVCEAICDLPEAEQQPPLLCRKWYTSVNSGLEHEGLDTFRTWCRMIDYDAVNSIPIIGRS